MKNLEIRMLIKKNRLHHYEVAKSLGISEFTFSVWLREEMSADKKHRVLSAIDKIVKDDRHE